MKNLLMSVFGIASTLFGLAMVLGFTFGQIDGTSDDPLWQDILWGCLFGGIPLIVGLLLIFTVVKSVKKNKSKVQISDPSEKNDFVIKKKYKNLTIEDLDLRRLSEAESRVLKKQFQTTPFSWKWGIFCAFSSFFAIFMAYLNNDNIESFALFLVFLNAIILILLSLWARTWSIFGAILLLSWHLFSNFGYLSQPFLQLKLFYIVSALIYFWGALGSYSRIKLIKKSINETSLL